MKVYVGFSTSDWWVSKVIRFFTAAPVSHTYVVVEDSDSCFGHELYEAAWCGFRMSTREKLTSGTTHIISEMLIPLDPHHVVSLLRSWLEEPYNYVGVSLGEIWVQIGKYFGKRLKNPFPSPGTMFCSEAVVYLLQLCPCPSGEALELQKMALAMDPRTTDPYMLERALSAFLSPETPTYPLPGAAKS